MTLVQEGSYSKMGLKDEDEVSSSNPNNLLNFYYFYQPGKGAGHRAPAIPHTKSSCFGPLS
jgi:hypothetical protein